MVRSAYGIGDPSSCAGDCLLPICCTCCVVNQLYQTTSRLGNPTTDGGKAFNTQEMLVAQCDFSSCMYAFFCMPCSIGTILQNSVGMPWLMGCCCFNLFSARNVLRYQYRLKARNGTDCMEECFIPYMFYCLLGTCANVVATFCPCLYPCVFIPFCGAVVATDMAMLREAEMKKGGENKSYLKGYSPAPAASSPQYVTYVNLPSNGPFQASGARVVPVDYHQQQPQYAPVPTSGPVSYAQPVYADQPTYAQPVPAYNKE